MKDDLVIERRVHRSARPKRDAVDKRVVKTVQTGEVTAKPNGKAAEQLRKVGYAENVIEGIERAVAKGIITDPDEVGGYPEYRGEPYQDADSDGMADSWEKQYGLDPNNADDASQDLNRDGYTNIEDFLNGLDPTAKNVEWESPKTYRDLFGGASS